MLSKPEPTPNHCAAIRLLSYIFTAVTDMPEFQRQVVIPNVQKCSQALLALAKSPESEFDLKLLAIDTTTELTTSHPTHHKALHQQLFNLTLEHLQGSFPLPSNAPLLVDNQSPSLVTSAIRLHAALVLTGGKVGAGMIWRQSLDSTMGTIWVVLETLRSTYSDVPRPSTTIAPFSFPELPVDPALAGPIALDRLRSMIRLLIHLLETPMSRPVSVPLGQLAYLALALLRFNANSQSQSTNVVYEAVQRTNEIAIVPELGIAGCMLVQQLAQTSGPTIDDIPLFWKDEEDEETKEFRQTAGIVTADEISASRTPLEPSKSSNGGDFTMKDRDAEPPNLSQNGVTNGVSIPSASAMTSSVPHSTSRPTMQPIAPAPSTELSLAPSAPLPASASTPLPSSTAPQPTTIPASSFFRSSVAPTTTQTSTSSTSLAGTSSLRPSIPDDDDDDEPMPQIDLGSDTDDEA
ncbi:hypothetical protein FRC11_014100 [Ceratobasidium sp. 423]|nr:hypothetical protein FRC11_014100 [Ceratobasidium sp. 423]